VALVSLAIKSYDFFKGGGGHCGLNSAKGFVFGAWFLVALALWAVGFGWVLAWVAETVCTACEGYEGGANQQ